MNYMLAKEKQPPAKIVSGKETRAIRVCMCHQYSYARGMAQSEWLLSPAGRWCE